MKKLMLLAALLAMVVVAAVPAMALPHFHHGGGVSQTPEQGVESGDSSQTFNVTGGGDNSNACQGVQGVSNTGNAANNTGVLQTTPSNNDGNNWNGHNWNGWNNWNNGNNGQVEVGNGDFTISPSSTTTCDQQVNQAGTAS